MTLWHVTTTKKLEKYQSSGGILPPVRGWKFLQSAKAWALKTGRNVILRIEVPDEKSYPLPDHRPIGHAWWHDGMVHDWKVEP